MRLKINESKESSSIREDLVNYFEELYVKGKGAPNNFEGEDYFDLDERDYEEPYLVAVDPEDEISFNLEEGGLKDLGLLTREGPGIDEVLERVLPIAVEVGREYVAPTRLLNRFKELLNDEDIDEINCEKSTTVNGAPLELIYSGGGGPIYYVYDATRTQDYLK